MGKTPQHFYSNICSPELVQLQLTLLSPNKQIKGPLLNLQGNHFWSLAPHLAVFVWSTPPSNIWSYSPVRGPTFVRSVFRLTTPHAAPVLVYRYSIRKVYLNLSLGFWHGASGLHLWPSSPADRLIG